MQKILPPAGQWLVLRHGRQPSLVHAQRVLLRHQMKQRTQTQVLLVLQIRLGRHRRPGDLEQIAQLEAALAVHVILQAALAELEIVG